MKIQLLLKGIIKEEDWFEIKDNLDYVWTKDAHFSELKNNEILRERFEILAQAEEYIGKYISNDWVKKNILQQTDEEIKAIGQNNKNVILVPISFVSEHSETLVELDIEYNKLAKACGIKEYVRVPTLGNNIHYITCLSRLVQNTINNSCASSGGQDCANNFKGCPSSLLNSIV